MAQGYFGKGHFTEDYWNDDYWTGPGTQEGDYWNKDFFAGDYWNENFWRKQNTGDVFQNLVPQLQLEEQVPLVNVGVNAEPDTEALPLVTFQADANYDINPPITSASIPLNAFNASVGLAGYQLGDISLIIVPDSVFEVTYGVIGTVEAVPIGPMTHTIEYELGVNVATSSASLALNTLVTNTRLDIDPPILTQSIPLASFDVLAGIGKQIPATLASLNFSTSTHTVIGFGPSDVDALYAQLPLLTYTPSIAGRPILFIPPGTWGPDTSIVNLNADFYPSNYEICDRTGFKLERGELVTEWTGMKVRPESHERRNVQDFVRGVGDEMTGSPRPEQSDRFIGDEYPEGVKAENL